MIYDAADHAEKYAALKAALGSLEHSKRDGVMRDGCVSAIADAVELLDWESLGCVRKLVERELRAAIKHKRRDLLDALNCDDPEAA